MVLAVNFKADTVDEESNLMDITMRTLDIMGNKISEDCLNFSDYCLTVETDKTGLLDVSKLDSCYEYGYKAVINEISNIKNVIKKFKWQNFRTKIYPKEYYILIVSKELEVC